MAKISKQFSSRSVYSFSRRNSGWFSARRFILIIICVLLLGAGTIWHAALERGVWMLVAPLERARSGFDSSETSRLRAALASTTARVADRDMLYQENLELKSRLGRNASVPVILAGILLRPPGTPYDTFVVDAGTQQGVHQGDLVSAGGTVLIGSIAEAYGHTSRVILFSAPGQQYEVLLHLSHSGTSATSTSGGVVPVTMQGQGAGSFTGQVPAGTSVSVGDSLVFPGVASGFVGTVSYVTSDPTESFKTLYAHLPVDPLSLQFVDIQKDSYPHE